MIPSLSKQTRVNKENHGSLVLRCLCFLLSFSLASNMEAGDRPFGISKRIPWTTSRLTGSPEPPPPYKIVRAFPKLTFKNPLLLTNAPGTERLFIGEQAGKLYSFPNDPEVAKADLLLDLTTEIHSWDPQGKVKGVEAVYALTFHAQFAKNRYCYVCYVLNSKNSGEQLLDGSRVSRFTVSKTDPPRIDPKSEQILITWLAGGHNGCDLKFGKDGFLYISTGDGADPNPPDRLDTGQDLSDLLSSILRIDVDHPDKDKPYSIPPDNPFIKMPGARPEIWAYGFRNPWRMSFDRVTGDLWVGDVGWELWEMIDRVQRGGNYGWSVMEGRQTVRPEAKRGPTPILPPTLDFPHTEAASITGGYVYRGKKLKDLIGAYICGDWVTRKLWGTRFDGDRIVWHKELAQGTQRVVAFCEDNAGEIYFVNYDDPGGTIHQIEPNEASKQWLPNFPTKLSATGLFASVKDQQPAPGVLPFSINAEQWADFATASRYVAVPGTEKIRVYDNPIEIPGGFYSGMVFFPKDGVLAKTISLEMERGKSLTRKRLETQILHNDGTNWHGYSYQWNDEQTDATLVPGAGVNRTLDVIDAQAPGGKRKQTWHFHSRAECMTCHNPWAGNGLAFTIPQINRDHDYSGVVDNQVRTFQHIGLIEMLHRENGQDKPVGQTLLSDQTRVSGQSAAPLPKLVDPYDAKADLNHRARSYLQVNCAHCHQLGAGGTADIEMRYNIPIEQTKTLEIRPAQGTFEIHGAHILSPGDPYRSVLYYRMSKLGAGRMPHIGSEIVDDKGVRLIHDWIRQLPIRKEERGLVEKLRASGDPAAQAREREETEEQIKKIATEIARGQGRETITAEDRQKAELQYKALTGKEKTKGQEQHEAIDQLLSSTSGALMLAQSLADNHIPEPARGQVLASVGKRSEPQIRDLFERFLPEDQRIKRLGSAIRSEQILSLKGDPARGRELFFKSTALQCINCHRITGTGSTLGPDLSDIGKKYTKAQILESILEPSKSIDPKYVAYLVETTDGKVQTGLLVEKTDKEVVLRIVGDKELRIPAGKVQTVAPQKNSLMPELLLRDLTAEQAADLVEFLASLK
jgi:putative heme-binding domain-containing protein